MVDCLVANYVAQVVIDGLWRRAVFEIDVSCGHVYRNLRGSNEWQGGSCGRPTARHVHPALRSAAQGGTAWPGSRGTPVNVANARAHVLVKTLRRR